MLRTVQARQRGSQVHAWHAYDEQRSVTLCGLALGDLIEWGHPFTVQPGEDRCDVCTKIAIQAADAVAQHREPVPAA